MVQLGVFTDSHNWPPGGIKARPLRGKLLLSFPQFHSTHHNNKLYNSQKLLTALTEVMMVVGKSNRSLVQFKVRGLRFPSIPTGFTWLVGFILCEKASTVRQR
jgi:hypothetical protein